MVSGPPWECILGRSCVRHVTRERCSPALPRRTAEDRGSEQGMNSVIWALSPIGRTEPLRGRFEVNEMSHLKAALFRGHLPGLMVLIPSKENGNSCSDKTTVVPAHSRFYL